MQGNGCTGVQELRSKTGVSTSRKQPLPLDGREEAESLRPGATDMTTGPSSGAGAVGEWQLLSETSEHRRGENANLLRAPPTV